MSLRALHRGAEVETGLQVGTEGVRRATGGVLACLAGGEVEAEALHLGQRARERAVVDDSALIHEDEVVKQRKRLRRRLQQRHYDGHLEVMCHRPQPAGDVEKRRRVEACSDEQHHAQPADLAWHACTHMRACMWPRRYGPVDAGYRHISLACYASTCKPRRLSTAPAHGR